MPSAAVPGDTTDRVHAPAAAAAPPVWDLEAGGSVEVAVASVVAVAAADSGDPAKEVKGA
jgi:hypothetical protein